MNVPGVWCAVMADGIEGAGTRWAEVVGALTVLAHTLRGFRHVQPHLDGARSCIADLSRLLPALEGTCARGMVEGELRRAGDHFLELSQALQAAATALAAVHGRLEGQQSTAGPCTTPDAAAGNAPPEAAVPRSGTAMRKPARKVMTAKDAVAGFVKPGACLGIGGFGFTRLPMTLIREIIRQRIGMLFVTTCGAAAAMEFLAANGLISWIDATYIGLESLQPVAVSLRRRIQSGEISIVEDYDNCSFSARALAARHGLPFAPVMAPLGSDLLAHDRFGSAGLRGRRSDGSWIHPSVPPRHHAVIDDPFDGWGLRPHAFAGGDTTANQTGALDEVRRSKAYTGREGVKVALVPPLLPEVTIIRAQVVGEEGTVRLEGIQGADVDLAIAARTLIVECERVIPESENSIRSGSQHNSRAFGAGDRRAAFRGVPFRRAGLL